MIKCLCFAGLLLVAGCSKPSAPNLSPTAVPSQVAPVTAQPTQEAALEVLRKASLALEAKNYPEASNYFKIPAGMAPKKVTRLLSKMVEKREVSSAGVEKLAKNPKWGKLEEVFGSKRAQGWTKRTGVPLNDCYGLGMEPAEVGLYWDGSRFLIIRLDDVGKL